MANAVATKRETRRTQSRTTTRQKRSKTLPKDVLLYGLMAKATREQKTYANAIHNPEKLVVFCNAAAGTGKTTWAVAMAKYLKESGEYDGLLYLFNPTEEDKMGFRPGDQNVKEQEYLLPLKQALVEVGEQEPDAIIANPKEVDKFGKKWVTACSHTFFRGTNVRNKVIVIDEAQNWTFAQLKKILTRCHDSCKVIVIGHDGQIDLKNPKQSGFVKYLNHFQGESKAQICELTKNFRGWIAQFADLAKE